MSTLGFLFTHNNTESEATKKKKNRKHVKKTDKHKNEGDAYYTIHIYIKSFIHMNIHILSLF